MSSQYKEHTGLIAMLRDTFGYIDLHRDLLDFIDEEHDIFNRFLVDLNQKDFAVNYDTLTIAHAFLDLAREKLLTVFARCMYASLIGVAQRATIIRYD